MCIRDRLGKLEALTQSWRDGGWQVRKRKGALFPEIVPQPGPQGWAADEAQEEAAANDLDPDEDAGANQTNAEREEWKSAKGRRPSLTSASRDYFNKPTSSGARVVPVVRSGLAWRIAC